MQGYSEVRYDEERKRVVYEPLQLTQAFRSVSDLMKMVTWLLIMSVSNFESLSPWEQVGQGVKPSRYGQNFL